MNIKRIKTEKDYQKALRRLEQIFLAPQGTIEGNELNNLGSLIKEYEDKYHPIEAPDPLGLTKFRKTHKLNKEKTNAKAINTNII